MGRYGVFRVIEDGLLLFLQNGSHNYYFALGYYIYQIVSASLDLETH